jgi:predicted lipid-binding transport protein (Tim44 family)
LHKRKLLTALFAVFAMAALVAGCGGGSDSSSSSGGDTGSSESTDSESSSGSAPTKAVFIKEADAICSKADGELNEEITDYAEENNIDTEKEPTEDQQIEIYEEVVLPNVGGQGEAIAELTPPEGEEEAVEEITDALASGVEEAEEDPKQLVEGKNPLADASKKARAYGMKTCGSE